MNQRVVSGPAQTGPSTYMPALDGLRALAVAAVVAYHLDAGWATGGFIGVDLFFVLSGFLITGLLLRESDASGSIGLLRFWRRRIQRLAPALLLMIATTAVAARLLLDSDRWARVRTDSFAAALYFSNWSAITEKLGYFDTLLPPSPLRHTWSLSIEEQFYIVWPLLIAVCCLWRKHRVMLVAITAAVLSIASVAAMAASSGNSVHAYYGTDTRAHELLIGALLAIAIRTAAGRRCAEFAARWLLVPAIVALAVLAYALSDASGSLFHGSLTASAIIGGIAVLGAASTKPTGAAVWLTKQPLGWIGRRSYAIYLWHWPVVVIIEGSDKVGSRVMQVLLAIAVTLALSEVTHRLVETPYRRLLPSRRLAFTALATVAVVATVVIVAVGGAKPVTTVSVLRPRTSVATGAAVVAGPSSITDSPPQTSGADTAASATGGSIPPPSDVAPISQPIVGSAAPTSTPAADSTAATATTTSSSTVPAAPVTPPTVLLFGDSTALRMALDVGAQHLDEQVSLQPFASLGCSLAGGKLLDERSKQPIVQPAYCGEWQTGLRATISGIPRPNAVVFMVGAWEVYDRQINGKRISFGTPEWTQLVSSTLASDVQAGASTGAPVFLLRLPCMTTDPKATTPANARIDPARVAAFNAIVEQTAASIPNVHTLPLDDLLCPGGKPLTGQDGADVRYDGVHTSPAGSAIVWAWLENQLRANGAFGANS